MNRAKWHLAQRRAQAFRPATQMIRARLMALACASLLVAGVGVAQTDDKPDATPPFLSEGVAPNLVISIDNSISMKAADLPDLAPTPLNPPAGRSAFWSSPKVNKLYYDPTKTYLPPRSADGTSLGSQAFTDVERYPFGIYDGNAAGCDERIDLETEFRPVVYDRVFTFCDIEEINVRPMRAYYHVFAGQLGYRLGATPPPPPDPSAPPPYDPSDPYEQCSPSAPGCTPCDRHGPNGDAETPDVCFERIDILSSEEENFANWYAYYRTRMLTVQTVLSRIMQTLSKEVRLTFQPTSTRLDFHPSSAGFQSLVGEFDVYANNQAAFYAWLSSLVPGPFTFLTAAQIRAGEFVTQGVSRADNIHEHKSSFGGLASGGVEPPLANACGVKCRNNFHLLLTDGFWEDVWGKNLLSVFGEFWPVVASDPSGKWIAQNQDGSTRPLPTNPFGVLSYDPSPSVPGSMVYSDPNIGMLADAAFYYWYRDLDGDAANNRVPPLIKEVARGSDPYDEVNFWNPRNDPATWQHLTLFTVGFGQEGAVQRESAPDYGRYDNGSVVKLAESGFPSCVDYPPYTPRNFGLLPSTCSAVNTGKIWWPSDRFPSAAKIDDLYHAGLNGRGGYFDASDPVELLEYFAEILDTVSAAAEQETANAPVTISAGNLSDDSRIFQAVTNSEDWTGEVRGLRVSRGYGVGNCPDKPRGAFCEDTDDPYQTTNAAGSFPDWSLRTIYTMADGSPAVFDSNTLWPELSKAQQRALLDCPRPPYDAASAHCVAPEGLLAGDANLRAAVDRIDWLRGKDVPGLRERAKLLGDILGSGPVVVDPPRQMFQDADYQAFKRGAAVSSRDSMVYVGANDGMLHAFNVDSTAPALTEVFAYVPQAIYGKLADLSKPTYGEVPDKAAYVDGPISYSDAKFTGPTGTKDEWRTVLVGALGVGAQGIYALDITDPTPANGDALVLWEFTDASGSDADDGKRDGRDMGYNIWPPAIVRIDTDLVVANEPTWVVLVGNGFASTEDEEGDADSHVDGDQDGVLPCADDDDPNNCTISQTGNAVLYVLNLGGPDDKRILARLDTGVGMAEDPLGAARTNGLAEVSVLDEDGDLIADRAYAGDLFGNLWRFDLTDLNEPPRLLFRAQDKYGDPQPITSRIAFMRHPNGGYMLLFGTGRFVTAQDKEKPFPAGWQVQTFYGIWDDDGAASPSGGGSSVPTRADLLEHAFLEVVDVQTQVSGAEVSGRTSTLHPIARPRGPVRGWMIDLMVQDATPEGERVVVAPQVRQNRVVFVSMIPGDCCEAGGTGWINTLDAVDGSRLGYTPFDYNLDGSFDRRDLLEVADGTLVEGSSIRLDDSVIYSAPSLLGLGGGEVMSVISDSEGDLTQLRESGALGWRTWLQLE